MTLNEAVIGFVVMALVLVVGGCEADSRNAGSEDAQIFLGPVDWRHPPPELRKTYMEGDGDVVLLYESGEFARISLTVFRTCGSNTVGICIGCGHSVRLGRWERIDGANTIVVRDRYVYRNIPPIDGEYDEPRETQWQLEPEIARRPASLRHGSIHYTPFEGRLENPEDLQLLLKDRREGRQADQIEKR
ncbi:MAG: hypothetical protein GY708_30370 [Actinomycetia bacterium]|nr:hypothetical protein [Actinomycetes bacterium]